MDLVPHVLREAFGTILRVSCQEILEEMEVNSEVRVLALLGSDQDDALPVVSGGTVSRKKLESKSVVSGKRLDLIVCADVAHSSVVRCRRRGSDKETVRAARAFSLVQRGAFCDTPSLGRRIADIWNLATVGMLTFPTRRPCDSQS